MNILDTFYILFKSNADDVKKGAKEARKAVDDLEDGIKDTGRQTEQLGKEFVHMIERGAQAAAAFASFTAIKAGIFNTAKMNSDLQIQGKLIKQNVTELRAYDSAAKALGATEGEFGAFIQSKTKEFASAGLPFPDASVATRRIRAAIKGMSNQEQLRILDTQFGVPDSLKPLFMQSEEEFSKNIEKAQRQAKITQEAADVARQYEEAWSRAKDSLTSFWTVVDTGLLPAFRFLTEGVTAFFTAVSDNKVATWGFFTFLTSAAIAATAAIGRMTAALLGAKGAASGLGILGAAGRFTGAVGLVGTAAAGIVYGSSAVGDWIGRKLSGGVIDPDAMAFWMAQGYTREQASGIVANEQRESSGNPSARGDGGKAVGLYQWHPDRQRKILEGTGIDVRTASAGDQRRAAAWEMRQMGLEGKLKGIGSPNEAAAFVSNRFEIPANGNYEAMIRGQAAESIFAGGNITGGSRSTNVKIDQINVQTNATDANGISGAISDELANHIRASSSTLDDGVAY